MSYLLLLLIDQALKLLAIHRNFALVNKGIAYGLFPSFFKPFFFILIILILFFVSLFLIFVPRKRNGPFRISLILILTGGISNFIDRVIYGGVVDYINLSFLPGFNLADLAISTGFLILIKKILFTNKN